jgi:peptide/nickel transport system permease protein
MLGYVVKRSCLAVGISLMTMLLLVAAIRIVPGDPAAAILGSRVTPELRAQIERRMGLDKPLLHQYARFLGNTLKGDLGLDIRSERPIVDIIGEKLPYSATLIVASLAWSVPLGIALGLVAAVRRNSLADRLLGIASIATISTPSFIMALFLLLLFSVQWKIAPAIGAGEPGNLADQAQHLILPALALGVGWVGYVSRLVRASLLDVLAENYIRVARAFGIRPWRIYLVYALRVAILPTVTVLGVGIGAMISGAVFVEVIFSRPGLGSLVFEAVVTRNYPILLAGVFTTAVLFSLATLLADLLSAVLDPRLRHGR